MLLRVRIFRDIRQKRHGMLNVLHRQATARIAQYTGSRVLIAE